MQAGQDDHEDSCFSPHSPLLDRERPNDKVQKIHAEYMQPQLIVQKRSYVDTEDAPPIRDGKKKKPSNETDFPDLSSAPLWLAMGDRAYRSWARWWVC
jgi:hypothetical protein